MSRICGFCIVLFLAASKIGTRRFTAARRFRNPRAFWQSRSHLKQRRLRRKRGLRPPLREQAGECQF
ncbi:MAG: hypothetical protein F6J98_20815 [Moorea sp. SIO4G2]|nr:hypothetical protein [Moorena sp. SIO4G2]